MRKIIHIDMDCFYAAVEIRDNPSLQGKPVAVGGNSERSVLCTCNYEARKLGIRSAMPSSIAKTKCRDLIILPVNMSKYRAVAKNIHQIFRSYTELVEPLALDEAYLDVSNNNQFQNSATLIAEDIRTKIWQQEQLTASAGVAPNKFLAKIASGWNKPNGIFVIPPQEVANFVPTLDVAKIFGVGKVTLDKLRQMDIKTCADLQKFSLSELQSRFGKFGANLYYQSRGIDNRIVQPDRIRKSLSVETTFRHDIKLDEQLLIEINILHSKLLQRISELKTALPIKTIYIKIKYHDFSHKSCEISGELPLIEHYKLLFSSIRINKPIRLIGIGVRFNSNVTELQPELFNI